MDPAAFTSESPGELVRIAGGYAFVPAPLPPVVDLPARTLLLMSDADRALGHLNGMTAATRTAELLLYGYRRREAVESSRIEGTQASFGEVARHQATREASTADLDEVLSYLSAMEHAERRLQELPLCLNLIKEVHRTLLHNSRGANRAPGEFRRIQVFIGGASPSTATYVPPPADRLAGCLDAWEKHLHTREMPPLVHAALLHYQFEAIHPFLDGNGRMGRLVNLLYLLTREALHQPFLDLSAYFEDNRSDYYRFLREVSERGAWVGWIDFYLAGVALQAWAAAEECKAAVELHDRYVAELHASRANATTRRVLDALFENPFATIPEMSRRLGVTFPTVSKAIDKLVALGVLVETTGKRKNREYLAREILDIFAD